MEKEEIYTISNMEVYKNISCYAKVINTKGKEGTSSTVTTVNMSAIATATDLKNLALQVNNKGNTFNYQGLFGYVENATITGVILGNTSNIVGNNCVGGIVGILRYYGEIKYCYNSGNILSKGNQIGGCCGTNLQSCYVSSNIVVTGKMMIAVNNIGVESKSFTGKIVGYSYSESLPYCGDFGNITTETVYYVVNGLNSGNS